MITIEEIIQNWCNESEQPCSIRVINRHKKFNRKVQVFTRRPGAFIGLKGSHINKYKNILKEMGFKLELIELNETFNPGDNWNDILLARMNAFFELEY